MPTLLERFAQFAQLAGPEIQDRQEAAAGQDVRAALDEHDLLSVGGHVERRALARERLTALLQTCGIRTGLEAGVDKWANHVGNLRDQHMRHTMDILGYSKQAAA